MWRRPCVVRRISSAWDATTARHFPTARGVNALLTRPRNLRCRSPSVLTIFDIQISAAGPGSMNDGRVSAAARERLNTGFRSTDWPAS